MPYETLYLNWPVSLTDIQLKKIVTYIMCISIKHSQCLIYQFQDLVLVVPKLLLHLWRRYLLWLVQTHHCSPLRLQYPAHAKSSNVRMSHYKIYDTCMNALVNVNSLVKFPKPNDPIRKVRGSRSSSSWCLMKTRCAGAVAFGSFSNRMVYSRVRSGWMKWASPKPAGPRISFWNNHNHYCTNDSLVETLFSRVSCTYWIKRTYPVQEGIYKIIQQFSNERWWQWLWKIPEEILE